MAEPVSPVSVARATTRTPSLNDFSWQSLAEFRREKSFPAGDSLDFRCFYVGKDDVHGILVWLLERCTRSLKMNMFGYDDDALNSLIGSKIQDEQVFVQGTLDKSQASGVHERKLLEAWTPAMRNSFVIGTSATHQISHTKGGVLDGIIAWEGSTNWSASGEGTLVPGKPFKAQNNTLLLYRHPVQVREFSLRLDEEHTAALQGGGPRTSRAAVS